MRLLLVRHGQTPANVRGELATRAPGPGLTPVGEAQAVALAGALADRDVDAVFVSPLLRTDTAWHLHQRWKASRLEVVDDAGHGGAGGFTDAVVDALSSVADLVGHGAGPARLV